MDEFNKFLLLTLAYNVASKYLWTSSDYGVCLTESTRIPVTS